MRDDLAVSTAYASLAMTMRRLAHAAKAEALKWEAEGNLRFYRESRKESDRCWQVAKRSLIQARSWRPQ